jgi:hypothetical protein
VKGDVLKNVPPEVGLDFYLQFYSQLDTINVDPEEKSKIPVFCKMYRTDNYGQVCNGPFLPRPQDGVVGAQPQKERLYDLL